MIIKDNIHGKTKFKQVRQEKGITAKAVAETAGISLGVEYIFEIGRFGPPVTREQIVAAFSALAKQPYRLDEFEDSKIVVLPPPTLLFTQ